MKERKRTKKGKAEKTVQLITDKFSLKSVNMYASLK